MVSETAKEKRARIHGEIRRAATRVFAAHGLLGASTQMIAREAGLSKAQLHYYITSKEELYEEILQTVLNAWEDLFFEAAKLDDPAAALSDYVRRKLEHVFDNPEIVRLFTRELSGGAVVLSAHWQPLHSAFQASTEIIQGWIDAGKMASVDPQLFQMNIWAIAQYYADYESQTRFLMDIDEGDLPRERIIREAISSILRSAGFSDEQIAAQL